MRSAQVTPLVVGVLVVALAGSLFLYSGVSSDLSEALQETREVAGEIVVLQEDYDGAVRETSVVTGEFVALQEEYEEIVMFAGELEDVNSALSASNIILEERVLELEAIDPVVVGPSPEIVLDVSGGGAVKNVILLIGDGMGIGQLTAAEIENGDDSLVITSFPYMSMVTTHSSSGYVTDSAASATAPIPP